MIINWTLEEELHIEAQARSVLHHDDASEVRQLCASLIKQHAYHTRLLRQATGHIAEIEMAAFLGSHHETHPTDSARMALTYSAPADIKRTRNLCLRLILAIKAIVHR
jgi:hypothetical protein